MLTLRDIGTSIRHALGVSGDNPVSDSFSIAHLANAAGEWLMSTHPWQFLEVAVATLTPVSGQNYISLPSDFRSLLDLNTNNELASVTKVSTVQEIQRLRSLTSADFLTYFYAVGYRRDSNGVPTPVVELYPTPQATTTTLELYYRAGWKRLVSDADVAAVPQWFEPLLLSASREYALGLEGDNNRDEVDRLERLMSSRFCMDFKRRDGQIQPDLGQLRGGAADRMYIDPTPPYSYRVSDPS